MKMLRRNAIRLLLGGAAGLAGLAAHRVLRSPSSGPFDDFGHLDQELFPEEPHQEFLDDPIEIVRDGYRCSLFAEFAVQGVVLSRRRYRNDRIMPLSPVDLAMGWGYMSNPAVVRRIEIWQAQRFYHWRFPDGVDISMAGVAHGSANMHLIPANLLIEDRMLDVRRHDLVSFGGYLCDIRADDGRFWRSSRTRTDTGAGACEIVWVDRLHRVDPKAIL